MQQTFAGGNTASLVLVEASIRLLDDDLERSEREDVSPLLQESVAAVRQLRLIAVIRLSARVFKLDHGSVSDEYDVHVALGAQNVKTLQDLTELFCDHHLTLTVGQILSVVVGFDVTHDERLNQPVNGVDDHGLEVVIFLDQRLDAADHITQLVGAGEAGYVKRVQTVFRADEDRVGELASKRGLTDTVTAVNDDTRRDFLLTATQCTLPI